MPTNASPPRAPADRPSRRKRLAFRLAAVCLGLLALPLAAEVVLRIAGTGYPTAFLIPRDGRLTDNYRFAWRYFPPALARAPQPLRLKPGPAQTFRVVVYGESAAMGDPEPLVGLPRMLEAILEQRFPDRKFEVVNAAMTAINSYAIADIAADLKDLPADLAVVYIGNNEIVGPFGPGTVFGAKGPPRWQVRTLLALRKSRLGQWMQSFGGRTAGGPESWRGMEMFLSAQVPADSPGVARAVESFRVNLRSILRDAGAGGRPVIVSAAAVNLRDFPPFASTGTAAPDNAGPAELQAAVAADPGSASNTWRLARALLDAGDADAARPLFRKAVDLDTLRFRCDSALHRAVADVAAEFADNDKIVAFDAQAALDSLSAGGVAGGEFFHEHVHLTPRGSWELARRLADLAAPFVGGSPQPEPSLDDCLARLAFTPWHDRELLREVRSRLSREPYRSQPVHAARIAAIDVRIRELSAAMAPPAVAQWCDAAVATCAAHPDDWQCRRLAARLLESAGRPEALTLLAEAVALMPHQAVCQDQGSTLNRFRRYEEAEDALRKALALRPDFAQAWNSLGISLSHLERTGEAADAFARAADLVPDYFEAHRNLASMLALLGDSAGAEARLRRAIDAGADDAATHSQLGALLTAAGRTAEAVAPYLQAAAAAPQDPAAQINAGAVLLRTGRAADAAPYLESALRLDPANATAAALLKEARAAAPPPAAGP